MSSEKNNDFKAITRRLYAVVSAPPDERDWEAIRHLYHPDARLVRTGVDQDARPFVLAMTYDEYIENATALLAGNEFSEVEIRQDVTIFGNVARVASVYEYEFREDKIVRRGQGVNFFNFVNDGSGWQVMSIVWDNERDGLTLEDAGL